ncbi:sugar transferase [Bradyrhizobium sp. CB3481]|uniref:sugar transferase n=1 Tax=Bradyrhizobium sp. CB3481 TaxID=3039158 RepID=UPI0024B08629|nr:sugar transferase [Bradyrhizobium sp. CB3481]WFU18827.1 sugar transferase [Bradyrhizobium sp. CB3481]
MEAEPQQAFPHQPPSATIRLRYAHLFQQQPQIEPFVKAVFDRIGAIIALLLATPLIAAIVIAHLTISALRSDERGALLIRYKAVSRGRIFWKYKFRVVRSAHIDPASASRGDWHAYSAEWDSNCHTHLGRILKKYYLDELPQLLNVLVGDMSLVGPRPLAVHHYNRDVAQGNIHRKLLRAGLFGPSQSLKGTARYGKQEGEYDYLDILNRSSSLKIVYYDLQLILACFYRVLQGRGL